MTTRSVNDNQNNDNYNDNKTKDNEEETDNNDDDKTNDMGSDSDLMFVFMAIICVAFCVAVAFGILVWILLDRESFYIWIERTAASMGITFTRSSSSGRLQSSSSPSSLSNPAFPMLQSSSIYTIPDSMDHIGDKSDEYALLRKTWDERKVEQFLNRRVRSTTSTGGAVVGSDNDDKDHHDDHDESDTVATQQQIREELQKDSLDFMNSIRSPLYDSIQPIALEKYDIYNCPDTPPPNYPLSWNTTDVIRHWPLTQSMPNYYYHGNDDSFGDDGQITPRAFLSVCVFDYTLDYQKALRYRLLEVPFVVRNDPNVAETVERWSNDEYRTKLFGSDHIYHRAEKAYTNEFLYWRPDKKKKLEEEQQQQQQEQQQQQKGEQKGNGDQPVVQQQQQQQEEEPIDKSDPIKYLRMTYSKWKAKAKKIERMMKKENRQPLPEKHLHQQHHHDSVSSSSLPYPIMKYPTNATFYYYRLIGCGETGPTGECDKVPTSEYLFDELPFFQPKQSQLYLTQPQHQRGIHCRFGMPGIFAQTHFDASRNSIVVLGGARRYILSHPRYCSNLNLYPRNHPSARHSKIDWSKVAATTTTSSDLLELNTTYPGLDGARSFEVVLQAGDVLYLPTNFFHMIVSLTTNYQCNTRSGRSDHYDSYMDECGFKDVTSGAARQVKKREASITNDNDDEL